MQIGPNQPSEDDTMIVENILLSRFRKTQI